MSSKWHPGFYWPLLCVNLLRLRKGVLFAAADGRQRMFWYGDDKLVNDQLAAAQEQTPHPLQRAEMRRAEGNATEFDDDGLKS